jgi:succinate dehydrogenase / fumarate reductase membrane anchor subunit
LTLALFHGLNGLRIICDDYIKSRGWRVAVVSGLFIIALSFWLIGMMTIITFQRNMNVAQAILSMLGH